FAAGIIGVMLALPVNGLSTKFNGGAVSAPTLAFNFHVTPVIAVQGLVFAIVIGALGGWLPARQGLLVSGVQGFATRWSMVLEATQTNPELEPLRIERTQAQPQRKRSRLVSMAILLLLTTVLGAVGYVMYAKTIGRSPTVQTMMVVARTDRQSRVLLTGSGYIVTRHKYITIGTKILGQIG